VRLRPFLAILPILFVASGCTPVAAKEDDGPPAPKPITFGGAVDPQYVGKWVTDNGSSSLQLDKDGAVTILSSHPSPGGIVTSPPVKGKWLVSGKDLLLQYTVTGRPETTVKYPATLAGNEMTLDQGSRSKMVYKRK